MASYRVLWTGSRHLVQDDETVQCIIKVMHVVRIIQTLAGRRQDPAVMVHGGARGLDSIVQSFTQVWSITAEVHPARWDLYGRSAGPRRNREMYLSSPNLCIGVPFSTDPTQSRGTRDCLNGAALAGVPTFEVNRQHGTFTAYYSESAAQIIEAVRQAYPQLSRTPRGGIVLDDLIPPF